MELLWTKKNVFCQENKSRQNAGKEMSSSTNVLLLDDDFPYDEICKYFIFIIGRNWHDKNQITTQLFQDPWKQQNCLILFSN